MSLIILGSNKLFYEAALFITICFGTEGLTRAMKHFFRKPRPSQASKYLLHIRHASLSFPSGHASGSLLVYGFFHIY
uniref:Putative phosphoesterase n=1 Tax=Prochloron didemni P3-Solomon TaxID=910458 RepID=G0XS78_PRODI|nr:putative phosphoesterase [Prochloron didemni P3-Solomon]